MLLASRIVNVSLVREFSLGTLSAANTDEILITLTHPLVKFETLVIHLLMLPHVQGLFEFQKYLPLEV